MAPRAIAFDSKKAPPLSLVALSPALDVARRFSAGRHWVPRHGCTMGAHCYHELRSLADVNMHRRQEFSLPLRVHKFTNCQQF